MLKLLTRRPSAARRVVESSRCGGDEPSHRGCRRRALAAWAKGGVGSAVTSGLYPGPGLTLFRPAAELTGEIRGNLSARNKSRILLLSADLLLTKNTKL